MQDRGEESFQLGNETMKTSMTLFVFFLFTIGRALPILYQEPIRCAAPQHIPKCLYSTQTKYFGTCAIYAKGGCYPYCANLIAPLRYSRHRSCHMVQPNLRSLLELAWKCSSICRSVRQEISKYRRGGNSDVRALIYLGVNQFGSTTAKSFVYHKTSTKSSGKIGKRFNGRVVYKKIDRCICDICWYAQAKCHSCCRPARAIYL